jgi:hypothetical protein
MRNDADPGPDALHGVSCDVCHRIEDVDETRPNFPGLYPGLVSFRRPANESEAVLYGALGDVSYWADLDMQSAYQPELRAIVCAACHQDKNDPDGDSDYEEDNGIVSEPTYVEWLDSDYGDPASGQYADCVDCHMPATGAGAASDLAGPLGRPFGDVRSHRIEGTTAEFLENAVTMTLEAEVVGDSLEVEVRVNNDQTGHHVPTGTPMRNMILLVEAVAESDGTPLTYTGTQVIDELGGVGDPSEGYYAGLPGRLFGRINEALDGTSPVLFTDAVAIRFDNRIAAGETDTSRYTFDLPAERGTVRATARLIYRRAWRALVDAKQWTEDGHGNPLEDLAGPHFGHLMESAEQSIDSGECCADGGVSDAGADVGADGGSDPGGDSGCECSAAPGRSRGHPWLPSTVVGLLLALVVCRARRSRL